ncbi:response regulator transcription factor [Aliterella atlantica]|uniref:Response regulator receiver protein n=1 Tax=Aliterella atlantica CENA595 TaxID=1618023 RepID=A0A0D8ZQ17_9CYAN|nr:response regulator transcription factor [Aliterella atlantica]KJH70903.1 response regulator receiver protein [Aliterella atlantica CENA595]
MTPKPLIVTVGCHRRNQEVLAQYLNKAGYNSIGANSLEELDQVLTQYTDDIKLVIVDISGFDSSIWQLCQHLRTVNIAFLIISPRQSASVAQTSLSYGARSMLVKPLVIKELLGLIRSLVG